MNRQSAEEFRAELGDLIGRDIVYVTAADDQRHFDPLSFLQLYSGEILLIFVSSAGTFLASTLEQSATELGKRLGEALWREAQESLRRLLRLEITTDDQAQLEAISQAENCVAVLGRTLGESYLDEFLAAGKRAIEDRLVQDNFPRSKAKRVSADFARRIRGRING